jgi:hypothetical protein
VACVGRIVMDSKTMNEEKRFPYEKSTWAGANPEHVKGWFEALERTGVSNVRTRLAQSDAGHAGQLRLGRHYLLAEVRAAVLSSPLVFVPSRHLRKRRGGALQFRNAT